MATSDKKNEVLTTYVGDVHALVSHGQQAIHRQVEQLKDVSHQDAKIAVAAFEQILAKQKADLETRIKALGGSATAPVKDAVAAVAAAHRHLPPAGHMGLPQDGGARHGTEKPAIGEHE